MRFISCYFLSVVLFPFSLFSQNLAPEIVHLSVDVDWSASTIQIQYDVVDAENDPLEIAVFVSNDGGMSYAFSAQVPLSGDVGYPVFSGSGKTITGDISLLAGAGAQFTVRLVADDRQPFDFQELVSEVDSNRLRSDLEFLEGVRHRTGGLPHLTAVQDSLTQFFDQAGLSVIQQTFPFGVYTGRNIIASAPGTTSADTIVIVDAHYDSVSNSPGADDNGSGTAGVMEIARLLSRYPAHRTLRYIGFDLEEAGLVGSNRYVASGVPAGETIQGVFNFEMIGYYSDEPNSQELPTGFELLFPAAAAAVAANEYRGDFIVNVGNAQFPEINALFSSSAAAYVPDLKVIAVAEPVGFAVPDLRRSDHASFWAGGHPAIMITNSANFRNECYHTAQDTLDGKLQFTFMANVVKATLVAAAQMAGLQHGDWATATFAGLVSADDPVQSCRVTAAEYPAGSRQLGIFFADCPSFGCQLEIYDISGSFRHRETIPEGVAPGWYPLQASNLEAGVYFLRVHAALGSRTIKAVVF